MQCHVLEREDFGGFERDQINTTHKSHKIELTLLHFPSNQTRLIENNDREIETKNLLGSGSASNVSIAVKGKSSQTVVIMNREIREGEREREFPK